MKKVLFFCILLCLANTIFPQAGHIDPTFNPTDHGYGGEAAGTVNAVCLQSDGKILIGGDFVVYNGVTRNRIARLNTDGTTDLSFNIGTGTNHTVHCIAVQSDGKIIIGGSFALYNSTPRNRIARLNTDGSIDSSFGTNDLSNILSSVTIYTVAIQNDGKILVGGEFQLSGGIIRRIARLNTDGSIDTTFNSGGLGAGGTTSGNGSSVANIICQPDGKILIMGGFTAYNGVARTQMARLNADGTLDTTFIPVTATSTSSYIKTAAVSNDGKIIIGGVFTAYGGVNRRGIARINPDTTLDTSFNPGSGATTLSGGTDLINSILMQSDGKIVIAGSLTTYNGNTVNYITRINTDGSFDPTFNLGTGTTGIIKNAVQQPDGKIIVVGAFNSYNGVYKNRIVRLNPDGTSDTTFNTATGIDGIVKSIAIQNDGKIIVVGYYTICNETLVKSIARITTDGALDTSFNTDGVGVSIAGGTAFGGVGSIYTASIQADQKIIIAGNFTTYNFYTRNNIARLNPDGSLDFTFSTGVGPNSYITESYIQPDGKIIILGNFTTYNSIQRKGIARLNSNGSLDTTFDLSTSLSGGGISAIATQTDSKLILVGYFTTFNGTTVNRIVRLNTDGTQDTTFNTGTGADNVITSVSILSNGKILIAGSFTSFNGTTANGILRLNTDGSLDNSFYIGTGTTNSSINNILIQPDGKIIISGSNNFTIFNNVPVNHIVRLNSDGTLDNSFYIFAASDVPVLLGNYIETTALQADGKLIIGGTFTSYDGVGRNKIARVLTASPASTVNLKLFIQGYFEAGAMRPVKFNQDGISPTTDVEDITVKLQNTTEPYAVIDTTTALLKTDGTAVCSFSTAPVGSFYVVVSTQSAIKTWSATPVLVGPTALFYDFSTGVDKAYGNNMVQLAPGVFGFYSGDFNQDGVIDNKDAPNLYNDIDASAFGILSTDLNGDGTVDNEDAPIYYNNSDGSIYSHDPYYP